MRCIDVTLITLFIVEEVFGPERDEVTREWIRLHKEELCEPYLSLNISRVIKSRRMGWTGHVTCRRDRRGAKRVLVGKPERKGGLGRPRCRWEDNIKTFSRRRWNMDWRRLRTCGALL
jgi:hypothetical protein